MSDMTEIAGRYIDIWNETDPAARRAAIDELWVEDGHYVDPLTVAEGRDAFDATVAAVQGHFPDYRFTLGPVDAHHDQARFTWTLGPADGEAPVVGFDVLVLAADGRIGSVLGFLDKVPAR